MIRVVRVATLGSVVLLASLLAAGCGGTKTVTQTVTKTVTVGVKAGPGAPADLEQFGYVKSLTPHPGGYLLRFDPAWMLTGLTASVAKKEDTGSSEVPNDYYVVNEGRRELTYIVPADARVTVLAQGVSSRRITVAQLAQLLAGKNPLGHPLFEPLTTGFWMLVHIDTVRSLDQQYFP